MAGTRHQARGPFTANLRAQALGRVAHILIQQILGLREDSQLVDRQSRAGDFRRISGWLGMPKQRLSARSIEFACGNHPPDDTELWEEDRARWLSRRVPVGTAVLHSLQLNWFAGPAAELRGCTRITAYGDERRA